MLSQVEPEEARGEVRTTHLRLEGDVDDAATRELSYRGRRPRALILVQNLPVPLDRRVWLESQTLRDAGWEVSVICPKGPGDPVYEQYEGVHLYKYRQAPPASGALGYAFEFVYCWVRTALLAMRVSFTRGVDVVQTCNPPDTFWSIGMVFKLFGKRFVFDHHDLCPEVYQSRFGRTGGLLHRMLLRLERVGLGL